MFVIFLGIDPDLVTTLADSVWQVNTVNTGIVEDYIHHIYHRFSSNGMSIQISSFSVENETRVKGDALWVLYGLLINSGAPYNNSPNYCHSWYLVLIDLILFLLLCRNFTREFTLLFLLDMFSITFLSSSPPLQTLETDRCLNQRCTVTEEVRLPIVSLSVGRPPSVFMLFFTYWCSSIFLALPLIWIPSPWTGGNHIHIP